MNGALFVLTLVCALGCALIAGVFFAFSAFVMRALAGLAAREGIAAMQSINRVVLGSWFLRAFFAVAAASAGLAIAGVIRTEFNSVHLIAGAAFYLVGAVKVTIFANVPLNNALAVIEPDCADAARRWAAYASRWTAWNHIRTAGALLAALSFAIALR